MEYVADELGVTVQPLPALQRELSVGADVGAIKELRSLIRARRPEVLHTHTAKAGATGRVAALLSGRRRPSAVVHTYHGHVLSGYFSPSRQRVFRLVERLLARSANALVAVSDEVRDDLVAFGVAPASRFVVVPYGFDLPEWSCGRRRRSEPRSQRTGPGREDVRRRLGRSVDGDQAAARPHPHVALTRRPGRRCGPRARGRRRGAGAGRGTCEAARRRGPLPARRVPAGDAGLVRRVRCHAHHLGERRNPGRRDRVAGCRASGRSHPCGRDGNRGRRRRERVPARQSATPAHSPGGSPRSLAILPCAPPSAGTARPTFAPALRPRE